MTEGDFGLGPSLRRARQDARQSLTAIRSQTGLSTSYLSQLEAGQISRPGRDKLALLAPAYGLSYDLLMTLAQHTPRNEARLMAKLPAFILEASEVLGREEWDLLQTMVGYLVKKKLATSEQ